MYIVQYPRETLYGNFVFRVFKARITVTGLRDGNLWRNAEGSSESGNRIFESLSGIIWLISSSFIAARQITTRHASYPHGAVRNCTRQNTVNFFSRSWRWCRCKAEFCVNKHKRELTRGVFSGKKYMIALECVQKHIQNSFKESYIRKPLYWRNLYV
jgi:hypothetical protein